MRQEIEVESEMKEDVEIKEDAETIIEETEIEVPQDNTQAGRDWRDGVYGNIKMSVKTLDILIGAMVLFIVVVLVVGAIKNFL